MSSGAFNINETIERAAWTDLFAAAPGSVTRELGLEVSEIGDSLILTAPGSDNPLLNRVLGVGPGVDVAALLEPFQRRGIERFFVHVDAEHRESELAAALTGAGLVRYHRSWAKLLRSDGARIETSTELTLRPAQRDDAEAAAGIYCRAFDLPPGFAPAVAALIDRPGWSVQVAREAGEVVAVGLLYYKAGIGYLAGGATDPAHRRRGAQGALVAARVNEALERGCRWVASDTGEAVPGDPQHSFHNMRRAGLVQVGLRDNYAPAGVRWSHG